VPKYIKISDCVVHTSLREGLARVIPQSYLCEKPVISFDVDGAKEIVINDKTGYLVPEKDLNSLKNAIKDCITNYEKALKMAKKGHEICLKIFSHTKMGYDIIKLYLKLLGV
jgi:glycosyltransferase involved in cell wall biosynthesis